MGDDELSQQNIRMNFKTLTSKTDGLKEHFHDGYEMIFVVEGTSSFTINNNIYRCDKNSLLFLNDLENHTMDLIETPYSRYMIIIDSEYLESAIKEPSLLSIFKSPKYKVKDEFKVAAKHLAYVNQVLKDLNLIFDQKEEFWEIEFVSVLSNFIIFLYRQYHGYFPLGHIDKKEQRILDVQNYIDEHFLTDISLDLLASTFYISKYYLSHSYKDIIGYTIKQYIILKRIAYAKSQLYYTNNSITDIAMESGFNSQSNFIRIFGKKEGLTPFQFRKHHRKDQQP